MFGDLMGNMQKQQEEMQQALSLITVEETLEGIHITGTAARHVNNVSIPEHLLAAEHKEQLEDLLSVAMNNFIEKVAVEEAKASQEMINNMMPGLGGMLGQ